jgi:hypothetical protein
VSTLIIAFACLILDALIGATLLAICNPAEDVRRDDAEVDRQVSAFGGDRNRRTYRVRR